ncbi:hypothetical protein [Streptomyces flavofungini]|uniref:hypothetical protein n=1 Tax=Streptomyces flavofungini TaxID=68200 RepID=UPI0019C21D5F|nr:hypothetical protein [Streptomyces flavofungini]GHC54467.1 hypothetical protein GCM10010349_21060 [Streptomyces flavofungini]
MNTSARPAPPPGRPRIALISATPAAIGPAVAGLADAFPEAEPWNLLDDALLTDAEAQGGLAPALADRMRRLIAYAVAGGARGVLLTCSLYGPVAERAEAAVPVLAADSAAFAAALARGHRRVLVLASFAGALDDSLERFRAAARAAGSPVRAVGQVIAPGERPDPGDADGVLLAQYSLAPHADDLVAALGLPVHTGPHTAARALRSAVGRAAEATSAAGTATAGTERSTSCSE